MLILQNLPDEVDIFNKRVNILETRYLIKSQGWTAFPGNTAKVLNKKNLLNKSITPFN